MRRKLIPRGKKAFLANILESTGTNRLLKSTSSWSGLMVMNYHRLGDPLLCEFDRNLFSASQEVFEKQVRQFQSHFDLVGVEDLESVLQARKGKHILITFDDGYRDNYDLAFPVLKTCDAKALFFIATGFIDKPQVAWWDEIAWMIRNAKVKSLPVGNWFENPIEIIKPYPADAIGTAVRKYWSLQENQTETFLNDLAHMTEAGRVPESMKKNLWMNWEMIQEMQNHAMGFGGHTVNHPVLAQISPERQRDEISGCANRLKEQLGESPQAFAYPVGQPHMFTEQTKRILRESGYRWAFSFYGNYCKPAHHDPFDIPRCAIEYSLSPAMLSSRLTIPQIFAKN